MLMIFHYSIVSQSEEVNKITKWLLLRNGVFPARLINKAVTVISDSSPPGLENTCNPEAIGLQPLPMVSTEEKCRLAEYWPQLAEMHMKAVIAVSPDIFFFSYTEEC